MRYSRLKSKIENGTLIGTHGTPFVAAAKEKGVKASKKRKLNGAESDGKSTIAKDDGVEKLEELGPVVNMRTRGKKVRVKLQVEEGEMGNMSSGGSSEYGEAGNGDLDIDEDLEENHQLERKKLGFKSPKKCAGSSVNIVKLPREEMGLVYDPQRNQHVLDASHKSFPITMKSTPQNPCPKLGKSSGSHKGGMDMTPSSSGAPGVASNAGALVLQVNPPTRSLQHCSISSPKRGSDLAHEDIQG